MLFFFLCARAKTNTMQPLPCMGLIRKAGENSPFQQGRKNKMIKGMNYRRKKEKEQKITASSLTKHDCKVKKNTEQVHTLIIKNRGSKTPLGIVTS